MKLCFDSLDELRAFMAEMDGDNSDDAAEVATAETPKRRGRRSKAEIEAANQAAVASPGFSPPPTQSTTAPTALPATNFTFTAPSAAQPANPLVARIIEKTTQAITAGHKEDDVVAWFRTALGAETAQATWEQIKAAFLPRAPEQTLASIAKQLGVG